VLIMGFGPRKPKDLGEVAPALCPNCGNHVVFRLLELRNWFSLFFLPIVPGRARHLTFCPVCQYGIELTPEQLIEARRLVELTSTQRAGSIDPAAYRRNVDAFWTMLGGERLLDVRDAQPRSRHPSEQTGDPDTVDLDAPPPDPGSAVPGPPAGWYPDPYRESAQRYWDGERWTAGTNPPVFKG
jgi:hypothetical protein